MFTMKKFTVLFLAVVILVLMVVNIGCESDSRKAKVRMQAVFDGITRQGGGVKTDEETAICTWYMGTARLADFGVFEAASDGFDKWRREGDIFPYIDSYTITGTEDAGRAVIVSGTIDGAPFKVRVVERKPVRWVEIPEYEEE